MMRYMMSTRSQGKAFMQRTMARLEGKDGHRWVFVHNLTPEVECTVRKWLLQRLDAVKALIKAMGLNPHLSVCGWPFCLDGAHTGGGTA